MIESPRYVRGLMGAGASAYLLKTSSAEHLVAAVRVAVLDPEGGNVVVGMPPAMLEESVEGAGGVLSAREMEILLLATRGLSNGHIASSLHVAEGPSSATWPTSTRRWAWATAARRRGWRC